MSLRNCVCKLTGGEQESVPYAHVHTHTHIHTESEREKEQYYLAPLQQSEASDVNYILGFSRAGFMNFLSVASQHAQHRAACMARPP